MLKAFVIRLRNHPYSERVAARCISSAAKFGLHVEPFDAVRADEVSTFLSRYGLEWTWAVDNTQEGPCPKTGLWHFPYTTKSLDAKIACFASHYLLWWRCFIDNRPLLILEHDAVFLRPFPQDVKWNGICQINDPIGATWKGSLWANIMRKRGGEGVFPKTIVPVDRNVPDGLAGNSAYLIKPDAAEKLLCLVGAYGVWPNDAIMCHQLLPGVLHEYYPFITKVQQEESTTC